MYTVLDVPGSLRTWAFGINEKDQIVGAYTNDGIHDFGYIYSGGTFLTLNVPGSSETLAFGINNKDQVVGCYEIGEGPYSAFLYSSGIYTTLSVPDSLDTFARGINDSGDIVGVYAGATTTPLPAALPLFATGLCALGLLGWRRSGKRL